MTCISSIWRLQDEIRNLKKEIVELRNGELQVIYENWAAWEKSLKKCPFCKSDGLRLKEASGGFYARCVVCWAQGPEEHEIFDAIESWNSIPR